MDESLSFELELILADALRLTADPPAAWIQAAAAIPSALGDLAAIERLVADPEFDHRFAADPDAALAWAGLPQTAPVLTAVRGYLG